MSFIPNSIQRVFLCFLLLAGLALASFQQFILTLPKANISLVEPFNGIVVITGGQARIQKGLEMLSGGKANKMLISGVGQGISKQLLRESLSLSDEQALFFDCCVEIEFTAIDTNGNARATIQWMQKHNLKDVLLVSANYHLPRAEIIFRRYLPEKKIYFQAVNPPDLKLSHWYLSWQTSRLLLREYLKFLFVKFSFG